jgi:hypothetical protein
MARWIWLVLGAGFIVPLLLLVGALVMRQEYPSNPFWAEFPWPVACTRSGCVTTSRWYQLQQAQLAFAGAAERPAPPSIDALTSLVRNLLVQQSLQGVEPTPDQATQYRLDVLHINSDEFTHRYTGWSLADYDQWVILPFLRQEAARAQRDLDSREQLFAQLSREQRVFILPAGLVWDTDKAAVVSR